MNKKVIEYVNRFYKKEVEQLKKEGLNTSRAESVALYSTKDYCHKQMMANATKNIQRALEYKKQKELISNKI